MCPCEPVASASAFCAAHMQVALEKGCPTSVKGFLQFCGASKETGTCTVQVIVIACHHCRRLKIDGLNEKTRG